MRRHRSVSQRQLKAGELVRRTLSEIFIRQSWRDPVLQSQSIIISEVRLSPDLKNARIYVQRPASQVSSTNAEDFIVALQRSRSLLRGRLGAALSMKVTPQLTFILDETIENAAHIETLLARPEVSRDLSSSKSNR